MTFTKEQYMAFIKAVMPEAAETEGLEDFLEAVAKEKMFEKNPNIPDNPADFFIDQVLKIIEIQQASAN